MQNDTDLTLISANALEQMNSINLLKITLPSARVIYLCDSFDFDYLGDKYVYLDFNITGDLETQTEEKSRPTIELANPDSMFHKLAVSGSLEGSLLSRYQLEAYYGQTTQIKVVRTDVWKIYQIPNISTRIIMQLRRLGDSPTQKFPPRAYYPPEFYHINI